MHKRDFFLAKDYMNVKTTIQKLQHIKMVKDLVKKDFRLPLEACICTDPFVAKVFDLN